LSTVFTFSSSSSGGIVENVFVTIVEAMGGLSWSFCFFGWLAAARDRGTKQRNRGYRGLSIRPCRIAPSGMHRNRMITKCEELSDKCMFVQNCPALCIQH
jgi:hypothetical protein